MNPGDLRTRVTLQAPTVTRDSYGGETVTWSDVATVWAAFWPKSAREYYAADKSQSEVTAQVRMRYRSDVRADWRVVCEGLVYELAGPPIDKELRHQYLDLVVKETR